MSTDRKTITVRQFEMMLDWTTICRAAGLYASERPDFYHFLLAGAIMRDEVVSMRVCELPNPDGTATTPDGATEIVLNAMTDEERTELRARIIAKFSKGKENQRESQ